MTHGVFSFMSNMHLRGDPTRNPKWRFDWISDPSFGDRKRDLGSAWPDFKAKMAIKSLTDDRLNMNAR